MKETNPIPNNLGIEERCALAAYAADCALHRARKGQKENPEDGARGVYRAMMPVAVDRRSAQCYIAMAAQGMTLGIFSPLEAKAFLYAGQLALAAHGDRS
jgi:hypothetical protein